MVHVGEAVIYGHAGILHQILHHLLVEAPVLDAVEHPAQDLGGVGQGLLLAHLGGLGIQERDPGALVHGRHLEGAAGAGGGLFKEQDDVLAGEGVALDAGLLLDLELFSQVQHIPDLLGGEVHDGQEGTAFQID